MKSLEVGFDQKKRGKGRHEKSFSIQKEFDLDHRCKLSSQKKGDHFISFQRHFGGVDLSISFFFVSLLVYLRRCGGGEVKSGIYSFVWSCVQCVFRAFRSRLYRGVGCWLCCSSDPILLSITR